MKKIFFLVGILAMFLFTACGGKTENKGGSSENNGSKELNIYTWTYFIPEELVDKFQKETGIKINFSYYDNNDVMMAKLMSGAKGFDIISPSTDYVDVLIKNGLIEKLDKTKLGETFNNLDKENLKLEEYSQIYDPGLQYSIPYSYSATGIAVNKKFMKDYPQSFDVFGLEQYKGKMTMLDDGREVIGATLQYLGYPSDSADDKQLEEAKTKILEWKKNLAKFDATSFGKSIATGEFYAVHGYAENIYGELEEKDYENFDYFVPKGAMMYIDSMAVVKNGPNRENAYKFLEFLYRPENFIKVYEFFKTTSVIKGIEEKSSVKAIVKTSQVVENGKLPGALSDEAKEKHDKIWNEIKLSN
ncbi:extracellular solute-binding protein [Leptotrichia sp. OH3620_COT-345]|uniref:extracellular solute-binding protein n=1 Tax=Leptotrichia sp. OH3620_COT-345 TaxID=2491048 RepID=UPI000F650EE8|nr:extracellular solute-binding protein [Leptotrichia sp. OH3620_COT-345]RRD38077.1 extracellular solute-binding protein [Leptotrichia sp. OH3620_COT-345]